MISKLRETLASFCWHFPLAETVASFAAHLSHPAWLTGKLAASYSEGLGEAGSLLVRQHRIGITILLGI